MRFAIAGQLLAATHGRPDPVTQALWNIAVRRLHDETSNLIDTLAVGQLQLPVAAFGTRQVLAEPDRPKIRTEVCIHLMERRDSLVIGATRSHWAERG